MDKKLGNDLVDLLGSLLSEGEEVVRKMANESNKARHGGDRVSGVPVGGFGAGASRPAGNRPGDHFLDPDGDSGIREPRRGGSFPSGRVTSSAPGGVKAKRSFGMSGGNGRTGNVETSGDILRSDGEGVTKRSMEVVVIDKGISKISGHIKSVVIREDLIKIQFSSDKTFVLDVDGIDISSVEIECEGHKVYVRYEK